MHTEREKESKGIGEVNAGHKGVSQLAGESWRRETQEVRELFEWYAQMEKRAHEEAWPDYKYLPVLRGGAKEEGS